MEDSNPFMDTEDMQPRFTPVGALDDAEKIAFYKKTYGHVAGGFLAFIVLEYFLLQSEAIASFFLGIMSNGMSWLVLLVVFGFATSYVEGAALKTKDRNTQYLMYGLYILLEALIFVPLLYIVLATVPDSANLLANAGLVTIGLFAGLTAIVFTTKKDFSFLKAGLTLTFFIAIGLIIAASIFGLSLGLWFSALMVLFAGGCILYQTSKLMTNYSNDQYVPAAIGLFASFMLLLWYVIQIFMSRD